MNFLSIQQDDGILESDNSKHANYVLTPLGQLGSSLLLFFTHRTLQHLDCALPDKRSQNRPTRFAWNRLVLEHMANQSTPAARKRGRGSLIRPPDDHEPENDAEHEPPLMAQVQTPHLHTSRITSASKHQVGFATYKDGLD